MEGQARFNRKVARRPKMIPALNFAYRIGKQVVQPEVLSPLLQLVASSGQRRTRLKKAPRQSQR